MHLSKKKRTSLKNNTRFALRHRLNEHKRLEIGRQDYRSADECGSKVTGQGPKALSIVALFFVASKPRG